jgi:C4-dicarboxylate-specific signal transduction histidine kinase
VLHNVGNVLNSVNVSINLMGDRARKSRIPMLSKATALFREHSHDLPEFLSNDARGRQLPAFLEGLAANFNDEHAYLQEELNNVNRSVKHIVDILDSQRTLAKSPGLREDLALSELGAAALTVLESSLSKRGVEVVREFDPSIATNTDRVKIMQILVNLLTNARDACTGKEAKNPPRITIRTRSAGPFAFVDVVDNGMGIAPENLTRVFASGFTTKTSGQGIGLHFSSIAAKELGGQLLVHSQGLGHGATFSLQLPLQRMETPFA